MNAPGRPGSGVALGLACAAMLVALLASPVLPMTDLPQHAAQLALWERLGDLDWPGAERLRMNWATPYLGSYLPARALLVVLPAGAAMHLTVALGALAFPLALRPLVRRLGGDPWWALLGVPAALGFPFAWGFLNFFLALPLVLLALERALVWAEGGRPRDGGWLAFLTLACLAGHFLAWGWTVAACAGLIHLRRGLDLHARLLRSLPLLAGAPLAAAWVLRVSSLPGTPQLPTLWESPLARAARLPEGLFGAGPELVAGCLGLAGLALLARPRRPLEPWRPWLLALAALTWAGPLRLGGAHHACERFAPLLLPGLLALLAPREAGPLRSAGCALLLMAACASPLVRLPAWSRLAADARDLRAVAAPIETGSEVFAFPAERRIAGLPGEVAANLHAWIQVERDVWVDYSFCSTYPALVQLRRQEPWAHDPFVQSRDPRYRWMLVRCQQDPAAAFERFAPGWTRGWTLQDRRGSWWLYRRGDP